MDIIQETNILHKYYMHKTFREQVFVVCLGFWLFFCLFLFKKNKTTKTSSDLNDVPPGSVIFFLFFFFYTAVQ